MILKILEEINNNKYREIDFFNYKKLFDINKNVLLKTNNFIYGYPGSGKTGLLKFITEKVSKNFEKIIFLSLENDKNDFFFNENFKKFFYINNGYYLDFASNLEEFDDIYNKYKYLCIRFPKDILGIECFNEKYDKVTLLFKFVDILNRTKNNNENILIIPLNELYLNQSLLNFIEEINKNNVFLNTEIFIDNDFMRFNENNANFNLWLNMNSIRKINDFNQVFLNRLLSFFNIDKNEFFYQINESNNYYLYDNLYDIDISLLYIFFSFKYNRVELYNIKTNNELYFFKYLENDRYNETIKKWEKWLKLVNNVEEEKLKIQEAWKLITKTNGKLTNLNSIFKI